MRAAGVLDVAVTAATPTRYSSYEWVETNNKHRQAERRQQQQRGTEQVPSQHHHQHNSAPRRCCSFVCSAKFNTTMASSRAKALMPLLRRSVATSRTSSKAMRGGMAPPMPPHARIPAPTENVSWVVLFLAMEFWYFVQFGLKKTVQYCVCRVLIETREKKRNWIQFLDGINTSDQLKSIGTTYWLGAMQFVSCELFSIFPRAIILTPSCIFLCF